VKDGMREIRMAQIGTLEIRVGEIGISEVGISHVYFVEIGVAEVGVWQKGLIHELFREDLAFEVRRVAAVHCGAEAVGVEEVVIPCYGDCNGKKYQSHNGENDVLSHECLYPLVERHQGKD